MNLARCFLLGLDLGAPARIWGSEFLPVRRGIRWRIAEFGCIRAETSPYLANRNARALTSQLFNELALALLSNRIPPVERRLVVERDMPPRVY
jgi:hypothetical protein